MLALDAPQVEVKKELGKASDVNLCDPATFFATKGALLLSRQGCRVQQKCHGCSIFRAIGAKHVVSLDP